MNVVEEDFELGFPLFKTLANFLINTNLIHFASFQYKRSERYQCLAYLHFNRMVLIFDLLKAFIDS